MVYFDTYLPFMPAVPPYTAPVYPFPAPYYGMRNEPAADTALVNAVQHAVNSEAQAIEFYERLVKQAPNPKERGEIEHALEDERIHLKEFSELYRRLTGRAPDISFTPVAFKDYRDGLFQAYESELEAYEEYRDVYLSTQSPVIRDVFLRAFTDEIEHAIRFGFLLSGLYAGKGKRTEMER